jgi:hypothetical protein
MLVERWWDTTHTCHIAGMEMTITPYDIYRLTGLRVDGLISTFGAFPACFRANQEYFGIDLGATTANLVFCTLLLLLLRIWLRKLLGWQEPFSCT